jgi:hypothetical protein
MGAFAMSVDVIREEHLDQFSLRSFLSGLHRDEPRLFGFAMLMLAAIPVTLFAGLVDNRTFQGIDVWDKPLKFEVALLVYALTLAFFARFVPAATRASLWFRIYSATIVAMMIAEMIWIGGAAMLGTASHFNRTPIAGAIYSVMGLFAVTFTAASAVYAWQIARNRALTLSPVVKESLVLGLGLVLPLTLLTAGTMASMDGHWIGGASSDDAGLLLMGWARDGGDLRVAHFFGTHAMHFIPAFGVASALFLGSAWKLPVRLFAALFVLLVLFTYWQALSGRPFLPWFG